jgi:hypothetical protein
MRAAPGYWLELKDLRYRIALDGDFRFAKFQYESVDASQTTAMTTTDRWVVLDEYDQPRCINFESANLYVTLDGWTYLGRKSRRTSWGLRRRGWGRTVMRAE